MSITARLLALLFLSSLACSGDGGPQPSGGAGGKADDPAGRAIIELADDWTVVVHGQLVAGEAVIVRYDLDRMTECRARQGGQDAWMVTGFAMIDGGAPAAFEVARLVDGTVVAVDGALALPPGASTLTLFFQSTNVFGCRAFDSNFGADYAFPVSPAADRPVSAVLTFHPDGQVSQDGPVEARSRVLVQYHPDRLATCAQSQGGFPRWAITGHARVDGDGATAFRAVDAEGGQLVATGTLLDVGDGDLLELWFEATSATGCHAFDSNHGGNHRFAIE
jgi:hypothetical protein